jgi:hypothetical protein
MLTATTLKQRGRLAGIILLPYSGSWQIAATSLNPTALLSALLGVLVSPRQTRPDWVIIYSIKKLGIRAPRQTHCTTIRTIRIFIFRRRSCTTMAEKRTPLLERSLPVFKPCSTMMGPYHLLRHLALHHYQKLF